MLEQLLEAVVSYTDPSGRLVSELFQKLPSKVVRLRAVADGRELNRITVEVTVVSSLTTALPRLLCHNKGPNRSENDRSKNPGSQFTCWQLEVKRIQKRQTNNCRAVFLQIGSYKCVSAMAKDIDLMAKNAKTYNEPGSQVFKVTPPRTRVFTVGVTRC